MNFAIHNDLQAFTRSPVGTRVRSRENFMVGLASALRLHDTSTDWAEGQHKVTLPLSLAEWAGVTCGVGRHNPNPNQYIVREYCNRMGLYLHRRNALPVARLECIVYTREAYLSDPQVIASGLGVADWDQEATHVVVAVLAWPDGMPDTTPRSVFKIAECIAGGNREADAWNMHDVREMCAASVAYEQEFSTVAGC